MNTISVDGRQVNLIVNYVQVKLFYVAHGGINVKIFNKAVELLNVTPVRQAFP